MLIIIKLAADGHRGFIILFLSVCVFKLADNKKLKKLRKGYVTISIGCVLLVQSLCNGSVPS